MENEITVKRVWLDATHIYMETKQGDTKSHPLEWFPRLFNASPKQRDNFELSPFGIHWPELDEDLSYEGFYHYSKELVKT